MTSSSSSHARSPTPSSLCDLDLDLDLDSAATLDSEPVTMPDGTVGRRRLVKTHVKKLVTRKVRKVRNDGEVVEDVVTEEVPEYYGGGDRYSESSSVRSGSAMSDIIGGEPSRCGRLSASLDRGGFMSPRSPSLASLTSPPPELVRDADVASSAGSMSSRSSMRIYTDTVEGEPEVETDVQEREETLPDGRVVIRKLIRTRQKQTIIKRIVMEGADAEDGLPVTDVTQTQSAESSNETGSQSLDLVVTTANVSTPELRTYSDSVEMAPVTESKTSNTEHVLPDGSVSRKTVTKTTTRHVKAERAVVEGAIHVVPDTSSTVVVTERTLSDTSTVADDNASRIVAQLTEQPPRPKSASRPRFRISMEPPMTSTSPAASSCLPTASGRVQTTDLASPSIDKR